MSDLLKEISVLKEKACNYDRLKEKCERALAKFEEIAKIIEAAREELTGIKLLHHRAQKYDMTLVLRALEDGQHLTIENIIKLLSLEERDHNNTARMYAQMSRLMLRNKCVLKRREDGRMHYYYHCVTPGITVKPMKSVIINEIVEHEQKYSL